ncbi:MAG: ABC transporter permease [Promethearchaeota archaeon]
MKLFNIWTVSKKNLQQIKRDKRLIVLSIVAPIIVTALFGSVFGGEFTHLRVIIINRDKNFSNVLGDEICNLMDEDPKILFNITLDPDVARANVESKYSQAAIIYPTTFTEDLLLGNKTEVELFVSYENPLVANYIINLFQANSTQVIENYFGESLFSISIIPIYQGFPSPIPNSINISICNLDNGMTKSLVSQNFYDLVDEGKTMDVEWGDNLDEAEKIVQQGEARAVIILSENFTYNAYIKKEIDIEVKLDGAEPQACMSIITAISSSLIDVFETEFNISTFNIDNYYYNNLERTDKPVELITYYTPAIICFTVFYFSFLLTMMSFLRERNQGTMERISTSPLKNGDIILGYILSFSILSILEATSVILTTILIFNAQIEYTFFSLLQAYLIVYIVVIGALGLGILLSVLIKTEFQILQFIPLIIIPFMLLSGMWTPIEALPNWLQPMSSFIPLTYVNNAMRDTLLRNKTILEIFLPFMISLLFAGLMIALAILKLNRKIK